MEWKLGIAAILTWLVAVIAIAVYSHRQLNASRNPLEWLPFFLVFPFILAVIVAAIAILVPVLIAVGIIAIVAFPFRTVMHVTPDGLSSVRRIGGRKRLVRWSEIQEVREVHDFSHRTLVAVLQTGEEFVLPSFPEDFNSVLAERGLPYAVVKDFQE